MDYLDLQHDMCHSHWGINVITLIYGNGVVIFQDKYMWIVTYHDIRFTMTLAYNVGFTCISIPKEHFS